MSSLFNSILTQQKKELLITGYIRCTCRYQHEIDTNPNDHKTNQSLIEIDKNYHHRTNDNYDCSCSNSSSLEITSIPPEISKLFLDFLDLSVLWSISGDELKQFLSAKNGEAIAGPSFIIKEIKFNLYLTPNGINESEQGYVQFLAAPYFMNTNIDYITLWYSLYCKQTNSEWNNTAIFYSEDNDCASWPVHTLSLSQIINNLNIETWNNEESQSMTLSQSQLLLQSLESIPFQLDFSCYIDIMNIEYKSNSGISSYFHTNTIYMNKYAKFQWNIYDELLHDFRYCVWGKYFFQNINVNWMLECAPNGQSVDDEGNVNILLSLLRLPNKISAVMVHMILKSDCGNNIKWDFKLKFDFENNSYGWPNNTMLSSYLLTTTSITFTVEMTVLEIYDKSDNKVPEDSWHEYGIIDNTKELDKTFDLEFKQRQKAKIRRERQQNMVQMKMGKINTIPSDNNYNDHYIHDSNLMVTEIDRNPNYLERDGIISNNLKQKQGNGILNYTKKARHKPRYPTIQVCY